MLRFEKFIKSETGSILFSIMLGLGVAGLFKMSCDSRSCIVYSGPTFEKDKKVVKYNNTCYDVNEELIDCKNKNKKLLYV